MNNMEKQKFEIVKKYIDEMDYMGLLSLGCPKNEYDGESEKIAKRLKPDMRPEEISLLINDVFTESFYEGIDMSDLVEPKYVEIDGKEAFKKNISPKLFEAANNIYNAIKRIESKDYQILSTEYIVDYLSDNPNSTLSTYRFEKGEFYENNLTGKIKEAFCYKTNYPKYKGVPLYVIFEEDRELFNWFASDKNNEYQKEAEYSKFILDWEEKYMK